MYILFDIGGTKTRVASTNDLETILRVEKFNTPLSYAEGLAAIVAAIETVRGGESVTAMAGGIRGPLNHEKTGIVSEKVLMDWVGRSITGDLNQKYHAPVFLENDTAIVGLGEVHYGAGKGADIVAYHTVSTGVGGARYVHGHIDAVSVGFEPGQQILDIDRTILGSHVSPTLENMVSGTALEKRKGMKPYEISQEDHVWDELAGILAFGLKNTIVYWSPDVIVLGGSMVIGDPRILLPDIIRHTEEALGGLLLCPKIVDATLKDEGGLYGAMALIKEKQGNIK
ncbi:ROK family protein [Candidatus Kaiserbacteria bacterium]|nr:MAG: ROK family protein [Candidatus Kaiserbacteria bacterium]